MMLSNLRDGMGLATREIQGHLMDLYDVEVSPTLTKVAFFPLDRYSLEIVLPVHTPKTRFGMFIEFRGEWPRDKADMKIFVAESGEKEDKQPPPLPVPGCSLVRPRDLAPPLAGTSQ